MTEPTPAADLVTALDGPFTFLRTRFREYGPTVALCVFVSVLPNLPTSFVAGWMQSTIVSGGGDPARMLAILPFMYVGPCLSILFIAVGMAIEAACVANVLAGRGGGFGEAFGRVLTGRFALGWLVAALLNGMAYAFCCFGGFALYIPFGLMVPALLEEDRGIEALPRSIELSLQKTGADFWDRPGFKTAAVGVVSYIVLMALGQVTALPMWVSMGTHFYQSVKSGNPEAMAQAGMIDPWASVLTQLLQGAVRIFTDTYTYAGILLVFHDARRRFGGADLERLIDEAPRG
jgi:hypothetical protein